MAHPGRSERLAIPKEEEGNEVKLEGAREAKENEMRMLKGHGKRRKTRSHSKNGSVKHRTMRSHCTRGHEQRNKEKPDRIEQG
jgi:hypothetical protein